MNQNDMIDVHISMVVCLFYNCLMLVARNVTSGSAVCNCGTTVTSSLQLEIADGTDTCCIKIAVITIDLSTHITYRKYQKAS